MQPSMTIVWHLMFHICHDLVELLLLQCVMLRTLQKTVKKKQMPKSFMLLNQAIFLLDIPDSRKPTSRHFGCNVKVSSITCSLCHVFKEFNTFILSTFWFSPMIIYYRKNNHWIFIYILVNGYYYSIGIINRILIY